MRSQKSAGPGAHARASLTRSRRPCNSRSPSHHELADNGYLVRDADPFELTSAGLMPEGEHLEFDPARIFNVTIGPDANATLHALVDAGYSLIWHR